MRILAKRRLCFSMMDGRRCVVEPYVVETAPDWITKTKMWEFAMREEGLISVLSEEPLGVGADAAQQEFAVAEVSTPAKKTRKKKAETAEAETVTEAK